jgi:phosphoserine aminotransferase
MVPFDQWKIDPQASFLNFCANETVDGVEFDLNKFPWHLFPEDIPACIDMSSNIGTCDVPWDKVGVVYFGAQKNLGIAGCTITVVREDLLGYRANDTPILSDWLEFENSPDTYYNTPGVWPMYITGLNVSYMNQMGGLDYYKLLANQRSSMLWNFVDDSDGFYHSKWQDKEFRSRTNAIFRINGGDVEAEAQFIDEARKAGIVNIKAHYANPGIRISMYNSMQMQGISYLTNFMRLFKKSFRKG